VKFIKQTASEFDFNIAAIKSDVLAFISRSNSEYDIVFADPPYAMDQKDFDKIVLGVFENNLLKANGMLIVEHSKYTKLDTLINFSFKKSYGGSIFSFFEIKPTE
ncbi:MAG: RsmD family RNA methyltransferase, partial [Flavobacterium sp.]|nr:RsmD family RNA methyltransferase [Flavobacterium sp.]